MDLENAAWMVRSIDQSVSAILVHEEGVLAGGWDGRLVHWTPEGDHLWSAETGDRIQSIIIKGEMCFITSGLAVVGLESGEEIWRTNLEGSADELALVNDQLIATSSVYDIEHEDFMESAIWHLSLSGEVLDCTHLDEKPWFFHADEESTLLGLGRPRTGVLHIGKETTHQQLGDSPVTCGIAGRNSALLGLADGSVWTSEGEKKSESPYGVEHVICIEQGYAVALEDGQLVSYDSKGNQIATQSGVPIVCLHDWDGPWIGRWDGLNGSIEHKEMSWDCNRARAFSACENRFGIGLDDGMVLVLDKELFNRRKNDEAPERDSKKTSLQARLRELRS